MKEYGPNHSRRSLFKGNILFSTLLLFLVCSFLLFTAVETYRLTVDMNHRVKCYYLAKIMKQMFLSESHELKKQDVTYYTVGTIHYKKLNRQLEIEITIDQYVFKFVENINNDTESNTVEG
ncbi:hypothetical protein BH747_13135 [Enterococcus villorum]|uniref:Competence protein ComGG n=1 Tax=Enterococcus villorum TaxID=112904 RepID=A0A1V8YKN6_9ENTE|nr:competence type IV pilus minor pilin ComGG [Enterococcus villorum]OQO67983.1 hypothetical protein BH747_13135 [Enterococcus villorum]OQO73174.1 hypothetical protein BH744_10555 [Enterococcus villorum]